MSLSLLFLKKQFFSEKRPTSVQRIFYFTVFLVFFTATLPLIFISIVSGFQEFALHQVEEFEYFKKVEPKNFFASDHLPSSVQEEHPDIFFQEYGFTQISSELLGQKKKMDFYPLLIRSYPLPLWQEKIQHQYRLIDGESVPLPGGVLITPALSSIFHLKLGDTLDLHSLESAGMGFQKQSTLTRIDGIISFEYAGLDTLAILVHPSIKESLFGIKKNYYNFLGFDSTQEPSLETQSLGQTYSLMDEDLTIEIMSQRQALEIVSILISLICVLGIFTSLHLYIHKSSLQWALLNSYGLSGIGMWRILGHLVFFMGAVGSIAGLICAYAITHHIDAIVHSLEWWIQHVLHFFQPTAPPFHFLSKDVFYIDFIPTYISYPFWMAHILFMNLSGIFILYPFLSRMRKTPWIQHLQKKKG